MWLVGVGKMADLKDELKDQSFGRAGSGSEKVKGHTLHTRTPGSLAQGSQGTPTSLLHSGSTGVLILVHAEEVIPVWDGSMLKTKCKRQTVSTMLQ